MEQMDDKEKKKRQNDQLDNEWVEMIKRAKCMGLSVQEVHAFLQEKKKISIHWEIEKIFRKKDEQEGK